MNEDYLWDKTGEDPEIKKLENALQAFRFNESALQPPVIPVKASVVKKDSLFDLVNWWQKRFIVTATVCAGLILSIATGVWFQFSITTPMHIVANVTRPQEFVLPDIQDINFPVGKTKYIVPEPIKTKEMPDRRFYKARKTPPVIIRQEPLTAQIVKSHSPTDKLTKEELYAYNKLMTALAVTSFQLKQVKDKIQNIENQTALVKAGR